MLQLARTASATGPVLNSRFSPVTRLAATTVSGVFRSSNWTSPIISLTNCSMASLDTKPSLVSLSETSLNQLMVVAMFSIEDMGMPDAYNAPTMLPPLVPATQSMGIFSSVSALSTPTWATDLAVPPLSASPTF
jgi:hypothetical protein